jgi:hypothetical protein
MKKSFRAAWAFMPFANGAWGVREHRERRANTPRTGRKCDIGADMLHISTVVF